MKNKQEIIEDILSLYKENDSLMDSILLISEKENIEVENIASFIKRDPQLREILRNEGISLNMVVR